MNCLVPSPKGYQTPIPWPQSFDEVWFSNVPHARLAEEKGGQNWITIDKDKFKFPGGGTQFIHGADQYLDQIEKMIPEIAFGSHTQVALDVGCGVASFGAYLLSQNVTTLSVAPKGVHEIQIQFACNGGGFCNMTITVLYSPQMRFGSWDFVLPEILELPEIKEFPGNRYVDLKGCITQLPEEGYGLNIITWPAQLQNPPVRLQSIQIDAYMSRNELFRAESRYWHEIIESYVRALYWKEFKLRNVLDMRAGFGGFAAGLIENQLDCRVLNVVPVSGPNTLPIIYDRVLIGVMHDRCEAFDTYPRAYDLLHAAGLLSIEQKRCNISTIMLEMDRVLRPGGGVYIRDSLTVMDELQEIAAWVVMYQFETRPRALVPVIGY
ncbi:unnamed protein product [Fraxinus pennsylvanica]|uniref:Methyltransferase n=1 Tax=Fraxinus pennsylvanica TaxID=56036 RepID=A0AAD2DWP1_9LAMI|nr:unnamed protein product [Fraxinus pennsylvanica]